MEYLKLWARASKDVLNQIAINLYSVVALIKKQQLKATIRKVARRLHQNVLKPSKTIFLNSLIFKPMFTFQFYTFRFGCCKDNVTAAKGPKQKGCEPDVKTTQPPKLDAAGKTCATSDYGCCPDGKSAGNKFLNHVKIS